ncbi:MAG: glycoside hydrolase family 97 N-terminal domain-containing protein, partial [Planctomycetes bacterium]|nr:glycoside hydrolase family 97 N-terminal domain-containing protein [Planctomycetota bacterium]
MVRVRVLSIILAAVSIIYADVEVKTEQLNPADAAWKFKTIVAPSKSDIALDADFSVAENKLATVGARTDKLSDGELSMKADDLSTVVFLSNDSSDKGKILIDLGKVQKVSAFCTYSWHEHAPDHGARGPQVYTLYGSENNADHTDLAKWTKIADVDTRPNTTGEKWNGQHGAVVSDTKGRLGDYRYLLMVVSPTASPKQANTQWTHTFFTEIDVHTEETLAKAGDFEIFKPAKVLIIGDSISIGYTPYVAEILKGKAVVTHNKGNAGPTMRGIANIDKWLGSNKWDVIHFNWGLWDMYGWQYLNIDRSPKAYEARLEKLVLRLKKTDAKLIWATTTPICPKANVYRNKVFFVEPKVEKEYLDAAARVMKKHNIQVNDLHSFIKAKRSEYARADNDVHYNVKGQKKLAEQVASAIEKSIDNVDGKSPSSALKSDAEARQETSTIKLLSSSGDVAFEISAQDGKLTYAVKRNRAAVIEKSDLGIIIDDDTYGTKTTIPGSTRSRINERYPWRGVKSEVLNKCNTMLIKLDDDGRKWQVEA